ncbi:serine/threonine-protein kinase [Schaalia sp. Marseille-Q2122]|uniref:serine/threonine-protein kinase n=1 Tax=Schaalia sp. Marseille-Q2122 TaxID=2736604 RepID=UPI00158B66A5|nr:serine/threonine-protein kinase [Schaalia sp. Marseille-Q2122]
MTATSRNSAGRMIGGRYMLLSLIAKGGMGEVWKARDQLSGRLVAAKVLRPELSGEELPLSRLRLEAKNTLRIEHPNIAAVLDSGEDEGRGWLVMELVEGRPLTDYLKGGQRLSPEHLIPVLIQMAMALSAAAAAGVVHRDIKPANVLIRPTGMVKITDFGISRTADQVDLTAAGMVMGTAQYLPPEQALGEVATTLGDLYALGVIAYEAAAGKRPFTGSSQVEIAFAHVNETVPPLPSDVPAPLAQVIMHLLEKEPSKRPASGRALVRELVGAAQALSIPISPCPLPQPDGAAQAPAAPAQPVVAPIEHTPARTLPEEMLRPVDLEAASLDAVVGPEPQRPSRPQHAAEPLAEPGTEAVADDETATGGESATVEHEPHADTSMSAQLALKLRHRAHQQGGEGAPEPTRPRFAPVREASLSVRPEAPAAATPAVPSAPPAAPAPSSPAATPAPPAPPSFAPTRPRATASSRNEGNARAEHAPSFHPVRADSTSAPQRVSRRSLRTTATQRRAPVLWHSITPASIEAASVPTRRPMRTRYSRSMTAPPTPLWRTILRWLIAGMVFLALVAVALAVLFSKLGFASAVLGADFHPLQEVTTWSTPWPTT